MRRLVAVIAAATLLASALNAQTTVYSTFGPGNTYNCCSSSAVYNTQWVAAGFSFGGPSGSTLFGVQFAASNIVSGPLYVAFLTGFSPATSDTVESWILPSGGYSPSIYSLSSLTNAPLVSGQVYWLALGATTPSFWGWNDNDNGALGPFSFTQDQGVTWRGDASVSYPGPAFAVTATVTPEPSTVALVGLGLAGLVGSGTIRRRRIPQT